MTCICCLQKEKKEKKKSETEIEVDGTKELHVTLSPRTPAGDPPETEELIKALMVNFINYTSNNHDAEFVSLAIKYFIHMEIHVESMRHISRRFDNFNIYPPYRFCLFCLVVSRYFLFFFLLQKMYIVYFFSYELPFSQNNSSGC